MTNDITDSVRDAIAAQFWDGHIIDGRPAGWADMLPGEQRSCAVEWRKNHPVVAPVFTAEQREWIAKSVAHAMPVLLRHYVTEGAIDQRLTALEAKLIGAISDSLGAIENSVTQKSAPGETLAAQSVREDRLQQELDDLKSGSLASHTRQLSRHADHLSALETRLKKLERGN